MHDPAAGDEDLRAQSVHHAKHKTFSGDDDSTSVRRAFRGWSTFKAINADHVRAVVNRHGGTFTVDDAGTITDVAPCKRVAGEASKPAR